MCSRGGKGEGDGSERKRSAQGPRPTAASLWAGAGGLEVHVSHRSGLHKDLERCERTSFPSGTVEKALGISSVKAEACL